MVRNKHNTPDIIEYPFWKMTTENSKSIYLMWIGFSILNIFAGEVDT